ncbi:MAG: amino acid ABC transporter ATP-binding protein [Lachnospiraceae bacterium]|nr:amino acid ABC transporter ATP-binding protein [Lachnospiraceae bacterium]
MIRIEHLKKVYPGVTPLRDVSVRINDGDVISVIGPSGEGKSTLLRCINLLEKPTEGRIWIDEAEITDPACDIETIRRKVGMVFQSFNLFPHLTVIGNIMLAPVDLLGKSRQEAYDKAMELLAMVGLSEKAMSYPDELSGGQKQRIAIARTLAMDPKYILMDEPTSALDPTMVGEVQAVIRELAKSGRTMMIVTHEMDFARAISNRVFYMDEGGIYEEGTPEKIFTAPERELTRRFIRRLKVLEFDIDRRDYDYPGAQGSIEAYCIKNQVPYLMTNHIRLAFEETVQQNLIKHLEDPRMHICISYSSETDTMEFTIDYPGKRYDFFAECDIVSLAVLETAVSERSFSRDEEKEYGNHLSMMILSHKTDTGDK